MPTIMRLCVALSTAVALSFAGCSASGKLADSPQRESEQGPPAGDPYLVKLAVLRHMFDRFAAPPGEPDVNGCTCFIIDRDDHANRLTSEFSTFRFPVYGPDRLGYSDDGERAIDKTTGTQAMAWRVEVKEVNPERAVVYVEWLIASEGAAGYTLRLSFDDSTWSVDSVVEEWMS